MLNNLFEKIFVINLDRRPDRWEECVAESKLYNFEIERISAVDGVDVEEKYLDILKHVPEFCYNGQIGCISSHIKVINEAKSQGLKNFLVLEDDFKMIPDFYNKFLEWKNEVPYWDLLYFGGNHNSAINHISEHVIRPVNTLTTHAYAMRNTIYDTALDCLLPIQAPVDVSLVKLQNMINTCYCFHPSLIYQRASFSDILDRHADYTGII